MAENQAPTVQSETKTSFKETAKSVAESAKKIAVASKDNVKASHALLILLVVVIIAVGLTRAMTIKQVYSKAKDGRKQGFFGSKKTTYILDRDGDGFVEVSHKDTKSADMLYIDDAMRK